MEELAKKYEVNTDIIIQYIFCGGKASSIHNVPSYIRLLEKKGQVWIGSTKCSKGFATIHAETIIKEAQQISHNLCSKYKYKHLEQDMAGDAIEYVLRECGDIDKNFNDQENIAKGLIIARIVNFIRYRCLSNISKIKEESFYGKFTYKEEKEEKRVFDRGIEDKTGNVQEEVEKKVLEEIRKKQKINPKEACKELLRKNIELGLTRQEAVAKTGEILGKSPEEILKMLQEYMIKEKKVRKTKDGGVVLGE